MGGTISEAGLCPASCLSVRFYIPQIPQHPQAASAAGDQALKQELVEDIPHSSRNSQNLSRQKGALQRHNYRGWRHVILDVTLEQDRDLR